MLRKQIYLDDDTEEILKEICISMGISQSEAIRRALQEYALKLKQKKDNKENPLLKMIGIANSIVSDASEKHDEYLYGKEKC